MTTTTSHMPHKSINSLKTRNPGFLRSSCYGSIGRPDRSVKRRSAVELLEESKAYYVKSESVLDAKQEFKNAEHLHVRSPTRVEVVTTLPRGSHHCFRLSSYAVCPTCSPYSYTSAAQEHLQLDHFQLQTLQEHYLFQYERLQRESRENKHKAPIQDHAKPRRASVPSPATFQLHAFQMEKNVFGGFDHSTTSPFATVEKNERISSLNASTSTPPLQTTNPGVSTRREVEEPFAPPPLPPKSLRMAPKPTRPHDFPQGLKSQGSPELPLIQPPPPPRRLSDVHDGHTKLRRLFQERPSLKGKPSAATGGATTTLPITLPSPILPPTPPPDVVMESPMSDSGPIISPPPAFSTPVTPMLERQNSSTSEKSNHQIARLFLASGAMSVVSASSSRSHKSGMGVSGSGNASTSDVSMRHSSKSPTTSDSSPMSRSPEGEESNGSADDDSSRKSPPLPPRPSITKKLPPIPKSVTENALSRVGSLESSGSRGNHYQVPQEVAQVYLQSTSSQTSTNRVGKPVSPLRRPILRSKSDLSHRYKKSGSAHLLTGGGGFTLVHVDLGMGQYPLTQTQTNQFSSSSMDGHGHGRDSRRLSRSSVELERFFDMMGLESTENSIPPPSSSLTSLMNGLRSNGSSPVFFSSVSSVDSVPHRGESMESGESPGPLQREQRFIGARTCGGGYGFNGATPSNSATSNLVVQQQHGEPSIVERNARVIKWLFNCRKTVENNRGRR